MLVFSIFNFYNVFPNVSQDSSRFKMSRDSEQFILAIKEDLSVINLPLKETQRIKVNK